MYFSRNRVFITVFLEQKSFDSDMHQFRSTAVQS